MLTYVQIRLTTKQLRESAKAQAEDSEARTRPYVTMDIVPGLTGRSAFDAVIENKGASTARDIQISLVGAEFGAQSEHDEVGPGLARLFEQPFDLAPGGRRRVIWRLADRETSVPRGDMGAPIAGTVRAEYTWQPTHRDTNLYFDELRYDLSLWPLLTPAPSTGAKAESSSKSEKIQLRDIEHALRAIAHHTGEQLR